ncbi:amino acid transporter [Penicillium coprophilum]|uniref:amino acid transporter n=1 Tax=Penicillium coprophilum TaxID=36646 RepID=UPI00239CB0BE|nr:amino acid transporter [Penicillium coprophilum]KAJ5177646.1 amino acid transporter [Penicillium coprophilum]
MNDSMSKLADQLDAKSDDVDHVVSDPSHKSEELPRQFSLFSTLAFGFSMTNSWLGYSATFITPLLLGGSPTVFFGLIAASIASCFITAGLAELASAYPSSGGQYHFAYMVSPPKYRTLVAFIMGWLSVVAWALTSASTALVCAQMIGSLAGIYNPSYIGEAWQTWMIYVLLVLIATGIVCLLPSCLPRGEMVMFVSSFLGFIASFIVVLATQKHTQSAKAVFIDFKNNSGWSDGTSFIIGLGTCMYAFLAIDGACHIAGELPNPRSDVPRAMGLTMLIGMMTVIPWTVVFLFSITDIDAVASSSIPVYTIYLQATQSQSAATVLTVWILFVYFGALVSCIVTTGRLAYAFSRDGGLPCAGFFAQIHHKYHAPVNATVGCAVVIITYGLIYIASVTAFNSFISMSILSLNLTYALPQAILLVRGRERILPKRPFNLGHYLGPICNAFSIIWVLFITILFCFPTSVPTTTVSMNYVSVVITGISLLIMVSWWGGKRKTFSGLTIEIQGLEVAPQDNHLSSSIPSTGNTSSSH